MKSLARVKRFINDHKSFLISIHVNSDGDALGSQLAFAKVLRSMGKRCELVNNDSFSREYRFLPGVRNIVTRPRVKKVDAAIILDCSDISRVGNAINFLPKDIPILNIDHHPGNTEFGEINIVDVNASCVCEILYKIFRELKIKIDKDIALCLYTGIVADTGSFRYSNTSKLTHKIASELLAFGVDASSVYRSIYADLDFSDMRLISKVMSDTKKDKTGKVVWTKINNAFFKKYKPEIDIADNILNFLRLIGGIEVVVLFKELVDKDRCVRVNLRSRGKVDVNAIARHFGGGGHKTASGLTLRNISLSVAEAKIIKYIKKQIK